MLSFPPVIFLALDLVPRTYCLELCILDLLRLRVKNLDERADHVVEVHDLLQKVDALTLQILSLAVLVGGENADLVVFVKCNVHVNFTVHLFIDKFI